MSSCKCPNPPGGGVSCGSDQLAICRVEAFGCHGECHSLPTGLSGGLLGRDVARAWAFSVISRQVLQLLPSNAVLRQQVEDILNQSFYDDPVTGQRVHFSLPHALR
jgi:hypothetical protein